MKKLNVFYFSGTGNTKFVALYLGRKLGTAFDVKTADITERRDFSAEIREADIVLIAFPIYGSSPPIPVRNFIVKYGTLFKGKRIALAETQYFFSGDGSASLGRALEKKGAIVDFAEHFNMPNNLADGKIFKIRNGDDIDRIMEKATRRMDEFAAKIVAGTRFRRGFNIVSHAVGYYCQRKWWRRSEKLKRSALKVNDSCVGCGVCAKNCPVGNITITGGCAHGIGKCVFCYRCVNLCPKGAITLFGEHIVERYKGIPK